MTTVWNEINLDDYLLGGYYIGAYTSRPDNKKSYLPEWIASISDCRGDITHISWLTLDNEECSAYLAKQGLPKEQQDAARQWYEANWSKEITYPDVFTNLDAAKTFALNFMQLSEKHILFGIGLHKSFEKDFVTENDRLISKHVSDDKLNRLQLNRQEPFGVNKIIRERQPLSADAKILGFEPVAYLTGFSCDYLCNVDQYRMIDELHSYPNKYGLIDSFEVAKTVRKWRGTDEDYFPWLIVQYPIS